jgi:hypothetical protein
VGQTFEAEDVGVESGVAPLLGLPVADCLKAGAFVGVGALAVHFGWRAGRGGQAGGLEGRIDGV